MDSFNALYGKEVDRYIEKNMAVITTMEYKGREWLILDGLLCVSKAVYYKIPPAILTLLNNKQLVKHCGMPITIGIDTHIHWFYEELCDRCEDPRYEDGTMWYNSKEEFYICQKCYTDVVDEYQAQCTQVHITDFVATDWVQFMVETPTEFSRLRYYVNCNVGSAQYGNILYVKMVYREVTTYQLGSAESFINDLNTWIALGCTSNRHLEFPDLQNRYVIPRMCVAGGFTIPVTNRVVLEHRNDRLVYSEEAVNHYIKYPGSRSVTKESFMINVGRKIFSKSIVKNTIIEYTNAHMSDDPKIRSFGEWKLYH